MKTVLLLITLLTGFSASAQTKMIVYFKDKSNAELVAVTERSLGRRQKNNVANDTRDIGVSNDYLNALRQDGKILNTSRWLNAVSFESTLTSEELKENHSFIKSIKVIEPATQSVKKPLADVTEAKAYGLAADQILQINLDCLHDEGYSGSGVYVAVIDAGFNGMDTITYFDSSYNNNRVLDVYDFVGNSTNPYQYSSHGTSVSSCIFANQAGVVDGISTTAINVDVALYVSEDVSSETLIEEFNLVAALERADSVGADIATISLGYKDFDQPSDNHPYSDMDGATTIAAIGVNVASSKGILVLAAAGNGGPETISTPCDADSAMCIGGIDYQNLYVNFSSVGPASDGQVKPDVVARARDAAVINASGNITFANGTSFATPIMAGAMACLIEANPSVPVQDLIQSVRESGTTFNNPTIHIGYGIPDMCVANQLLNQAGIEELTNEEINIYPVPTNDWIFIENADLAEKATVQIVNVLGEIVFDQEVTKVNDVYLLDVSQLTTGSYTTIIQSEDGLNFLGRFMKID